MQSCIQKLSVPPSSDKGNQGNRIKKLQNLPVFDRRFYLLKVIFRSYPWPLTPPLLEGTAEKNSENLGRCFPAQHFHRRRYPGALRPVEGSGSMENDR